jgi:hypothetical protein
LKEFAITALWCLLGTASSAITLVVILASIKAIIKEIRKK